MDSGAMEDALDRARKLGARGCELLFDHATAHELTLTRGRAQAAPASESSHLDLTVWLDDGRRGKVRGDADDFESLLEKALAAAAGAEPSPGSGPVDRLRPVVGGLGIADRRFGHLDTEARAEVIEEAARSVKSEDKRCRPTGLRYRDEVRLRRFANSKGVRLEERSTRYDAWGTVELGELALGEHVASRAFASVASFPFGTALARRAVELSMNGEQLDGVVKAMLPPRTVARIIEAIGDAFTVERLSGEQPFFAVRRDDGSAPLDEQLHLLDDGKLPGGLHTRSFDDRGVVPVPLTFLREGAADQAMVTPAQARRDGVTPTGHVRGDALGCGNLALKAGTRSMNATYTDHDTWSLEVDDLDLSGLDLATGVARVTLDGRVMKSNEQRGAMRRVGAVVDLSRMLANVLKVCSDTDRIRAVDAPALFVDGLELT